LSPLPNSDDPRSPELPADGVECSSCHRFFEEAQLVHFGTRLLCWGCLTAWFDDDGESNDHGSSD